MENGFDNDERKKLKRQKTKEMKGGKKRENN